MDIAESQFQGPSLLLYHNLQTSFLFFLRLVTVGLSALQFVGSLVTLVLCLTMILTYCLFTFTYNNPTHTPWSAPSPTDSIRGGEPMYLVIPFPKTTDWILTLQKPNFFLYTLTGVSGQSTSLAPTLSVTPNSMSTQSTSSQTMSAATTSATTSMNPTSVTTTEAPPKKSKPINNFRGVLSP